MSNVAEMRPVELVAAHQVVADRLRTAVHLGQYREGDRLPPERELAAALGVSRVTLREALAALEREGYISERRRGGGPPTVLPPGEAALRRRHRLQDMIGGLEELLEFRAAVESEAARLAAERRSEHDLLVLAGSVDALAAAQDLSQFRAADSRFHVAIGTAARNPFLERAVESARAQMFAPIDAMPFNIVVKSSMTAHKRILRAIERQDSRAAERAMRTHLQESLQELRDVLLPRP